MSKWDLLKTIKNNRRYLTERQLVKMTQKSQPSVNRQLNSLVKGRRVEVKSKIKLINNSRKTVKHYRYRR